MSLVQTQASPSRLCHCGRTQGRTLLSPIGGLRREACMSLVKSLARSRHHGLHHLEVSWATIRSSRSGSFIMPLRAHHGPFLEGPYLLCRPLYHNLRPMSARPHLYLRQAQHYFRARQSRLPPWRTNRPLSPHLHWLLLKRPIRKTRRQPRTTVHLHK